MGIKKRRVFSDKGGDIKPSMETIIWTLVGIPIVLFLLFGFRKILSDGDQPVISSHHLSPELFLYLAKRIYHKDLDLYLCSIGGKSFGLGEQFSDFVTLLAKKAVSEICAFLKGK